LKADRWTRLENSIITHLLTVRDNVKSVFEEFQKLNREKRTAAAALAQIYKTRQELVNCGTLMIEKRRVIGSKESDIHKPTMIIGPPELKRAGKITYLSSPVTFLHHGI
jgi:hypothetical protein